MYFVKFRLKFFCIFLFTVLRKWRCSVSSRFTCWRGVTHSQDYLNDGIFCWLITMLQRNWTIINYVNSVLSDLIATFLFILTPNARRVSSLTAGTGHSPSAFCLLLNVTVFSHGLQSFQLGKGGRMEAVMTVAVGPRSGRRPRERVYYCAVGFTVLNSQSLGLLQCYDVHQSNLKRPQLHKHWNWSDGMDLLCCWAQHACEAFEFSTGLWLLHVTELSYQSLHT